MSLDHIKNVADGTVISAAIAGWHFNWPDLAAGFAIVYTITRLIIEGPRLIAAVKAWFK